MDQLRAHLLVVPVAGAAVNQGEIAVLVCLGEIAHGHRRLGRGVGGRGGVVVPRGAGGLVARVVITQPQLAMEPEDGCRIAGDVPALPTGFVVPCVLDRNALLAPELGLHLHDVVVRDALHDQLALGFQLEKLLAVIFRRQLAVTLENALLGLLRHELDVLIRDGVLGHEIPFRQCVQCRPRRPAEGGDIPREPLRYPCAGTSGMQSAANE